MHNINFANPLLASHSSYLINLVLCYDPSFVVCLFCFSLANLYPQFPSKCCVENAFSMHTGTHTTHTAHTEAWYCTSELGFNPSQPACLQHSLLQAVRAVSLSVHGCQPNPARWQVIVPHREEQIGFDSKGCSSVSDTPMAYINFEIIVKVSIKITSNNVLRLHQHSTAWCLK